MLEKLSHIDCMGGDVMIDAALSSMPVSEEAKEAFNKVVMEILCEIEMEKFKKLSQNVNQSDEVTTEIAS